MLPESSDHPNPKDLTQNQAEGESSQQAGKEGEEEQSAGPLVYTLSSQKSRREGSEVIGPR